MENFNPYASSDFEFTEQGTNLLGEGEKCFIFPSGPFFTKDYTLIAKGVELVEGKDFIFILPYVEATHRTAMRIFGGIFLFNGIGTIPTLRAISLGSRYQQTTVELQSKLQDKSLVEIFDATYDDCLSDSYVPPVKVQFDLNNWYGEEEFAAQATILKDTLLLHKEDETIVYGVLKHWTDFIETYIASPAIQAHLIARGNVHRHTPEELGARRINNNAADTNKVFGYTKEELSSLAISTMPQLTDLNSKIKYTGGRVTKLTFDKALSLLAGSGFTIDRHEEQMQVHGSIHQRISSKRIGGEDKVIVNIGGVELLIDGVENAIYLDGYELVTGHNIDQIAADNSTVEADIKTTNSETMTWTGDGSTNNPLIPSLNESTFVGNGYDTIDHTPKQNSGKGISPVGAKVVSDEIATKAVKGWRVGGVTLDKDINLTKENFGGLEAVENYSDLNMPLSDAAKSKVLEYSPKSHTHPQSDFTLPAATTETPGIFRYGEYNALDVDTLFNWYTQLRSYQTISEGAVDGVSLNVVVFGEGDSSRLESVILNQWRLVMPSIDLTYRGVKQTIPSVALDLSLLPEYENRYFYISIDLNTLTYEADETYDNKKFVIGWVYTDNLGIYSYDIRQIIKEMLSGTNERHIAERYTPHANMVFNKWFLKLENLENLPFVYEATSESDGYATTIGALTLFSQHNTLYQFSMVLTDTLKAKLDDGTFLNWVSSSFPVRQMVQENPSNIPASNMVYQIESGGNTIRVWGYLEQSGFIDETDPNNPNPNYPVGSYYYTYQDFNPSSYLGGTWEKVVTLEVPEENRIYYNKDIGAYQEELDYIPTNENYRYVVLLPENDYNTGLAIDVVFGDGTEGLEITLPGSPVDGFRYPYAYSEAGVMTFVMVDKVTGILTPLEDPKFVWIRTE